MTKPKSNKIKIYCKNGKPIEVTKNYVEGIKKQMVRKIKADRMEHPEIAELYFYGIAEYCYIKETDVTVLVMKYGDVLCAMDEDKKGRVYVEVPIRVKPSKKSC
ncbi:MAG: hypothetical protein IPJ01_11140 [Micavibrio sp.]|nr:hypothetical protein [Micavibrio sp.]